MVQLEQPGALFWTVSSPLSSSWACVYVWVGGGVDIRSLALCCAIQVMGPKDLTLWIEPESPQHACQWHRGAAVPARREHLCRQG